MRRAWIDSCFVAALLAGVFILVEVVVNIHNKDGTSTQPMDKIEAPTTATVAQ